MVFDGISPKTIPIMNEQGIQNGVKIVGKNSEDNIIDRWQETMFMGAKEYHEKALSVQIKTIGKCINEALEKGLLRIKLPFELFCFVKEAVLKLDWGYNTEEGKTVLYLKNLSEYSERLKKDKPIKVTSDVGDLFLSAEEYYRKVRKVQIEIIKQEIENSIKTGQSEFNFSIAILPELVMEMCRAGYYIAADKYGVPIKQQYAYIKELDVERITKNLDLKQD